MHRGQALFARMELDEAGGDTGRVPHWMKVVSAAIAR